MSQLKRIERYDRNDRPEKRDKSARHLFRLFEQAEQLLTTGELDLRVSDPDELRRLSELPYSEIKDYFIDMDQWLRHLPSDLPERADREKISELVREIRIEELKEWGYHPDPPDSDW